MTRGSKTRRRAFIAEAWDRRYGLCKYTDPCVSERVARAVMSKGGPDIMTHGCEIRVRSTLTTKKVFTRA